MNSMCDSWPRQKMPSSQIEDDTFSTKQEALKITKIQNFKMVILSRAFFAVFPCTTFPLIQEGTLDPVG